MAKIDKVKALKFENAIDGTESDTRPTQTDPTEDYMSAKGVAFENSDDTFVRGESGVMEFKDQDTDNSDSTYKLFDLRNALTNFFSFSGWSSSNVRDAIVESKTLAVDQTRTHRVFQHSGIMTDGFWHGYQDVLNSFDTPLVIPWDCTLKEYVISNAESNVSGQMDFYLNGTSACDIVHSITYTSMNRSQINYPDINMSSGDLLRLRWSSNGNSPRDVISTFDIVLT